MAWRVRWGTVFHTKNYSYIISLCTLSSQELFRFSFLLNKALEIRAFIWLCLDQKRQRSWSWTVLWRPTRPFRTNTQKRCPFHYRGLECKSRKSWNTWSNRQIWPWSTAWSRAKANRVLPWECTGHSKHPLPTTQEETLHMDITRRSTLKSDWLYSLQPKMEKLYLVSKSKTGSWWWLGSWTPYCQIQTEIEESRENH